MRTLFMVCLIALAASGAEAKPVTYQCGKYVVEADYDNSKAVYHGICGDTPLAKAKTASGTKFAGKKDEDKTYELLSKGDKVVFTVNKKPYECRLK